MQIFATHVGLQIRHK